MHIIDIIQNIVLPNLQHMGSWGYCVVFFATLLETILIIGLFVPGSTIVLLLGALSANGYYNFATLMLFAIGAALIGDNINYYLGKKYGLSFIKNKKLIKEKHLEKAKQFFNSYGAKSLFLGRLLPGLKETFPFIAGSARMDMKKFIFWDLIGCIIWSFEFLFAGFVFGSSISLARAWLGNISLFFAFLFLLFIVFYSIKFILIRNIDTVWQFNKSLFYSLKANPDVVKIIEKHKTIFQFIEKRLDIRTFFGLKLTVLLLLFVYAISIFVGIVLDIVNFGQIAKFDLMFASLLSSFRNMHIVKTFLFITAFGNTSTIAVLMFFILIFFVIYKRYGYAVSLIASVIFSVSLSTLFKHLIHRARPAIEVYNSAGFSFPSGHATISLAFYSFLSYVFIKEASSLKSKINIAFAGFLIAFLIGLSRIILGVHYFSDVAAGYIIGSLGLIIGIGINEYLLERNTKQYNKLTFLSEAFIVIIFALVWLYAGISFKPTLLKPKSRSFVSVSNVADIFKQNPNLRYTHTILHEKQEPINIILVAKNDKILKQVIKRIHWYISDKFSIHSLNKFAYSLLFNKTYNTAPISPDFWNYQVNNFGIEKPIESVVKRDHGRIWETNFVIDEEKIFVAAFSLDKGFRYITHKISPNVDKERDFFLKCLKNADLIRRYNIIRLTKPLTGENFYGDRFFTDGKAYIVWIKN